MEFLVPLVGYRTHSDKVLNLSWFSRASLNTKFTCKHKKCTCNYCPPSSNFSRGYPYIGNSGRKLVLPQKVQNCSFCIQKHRCGMLKVEIGGQNSCCRRGALKKKSHRLETCVEGLFLQGKIFCKQVYVLNGGCCMVVPPPTDKLQCQKCSNQLHLSILNSGTPCEDASMWALRFSVTVISFLHQ